MDSRLDKLRETLEAAVEGMSSEQWSWHLPGKWSAAEVLEHLYLSYVGTINGFERVVRRGKPLTTRASMRQRALRLVCLGLNHIPGGVKAPPIVQPKGLPVEKVRNEIGEKMLAMDAAAADAREVFLPQVELGTQKLRDLKLPAIDLSAIGKACGGQIDGILGVDLLDRIGMTIDLKRGVATLAPVPEPGDSGDALTAAERDLKPCIVAFNHGDAKAMAECFDPEIVFYSQHGEYHGREEVMQYLSHRFFEDDPRLHYDATPHDVRLLGDVLWYSYDFRIDTPEEHLAGHGMTLCRKDAGGRWRMLSVENSLREAAAAPDRVH
jgi:ketosteroid isomerase-like protein